MNKPATHSFIQSVEQSSNQSEKSFPLTPSATSSWWRWRNPTGIQRSATLNHSMANQKPQPHPSPQTGPFESGSCRSARDTSAGCATFPCWRLFAQARVIRIGVVISTVCGLGSFFSLPSSGDHPHSQPLDHPPKGRHLMETRSLALKLPEELLRG